MSRGARKEVEDWLFDQLFIAYIEARKHKRHTRDEHAFEMNDIENIMLLRDDILNHNYKPSRGVAFIIHDPVQREIFAAPFRDRLVHHFLYNMVAEWWDRRFIYDSYSCRKGKGTLMGVKRMQQHMRQVTETGKYEAYAIKMDLQGYFMSLPRKLIYERVCWGLERQFVDPKMAWLKDLLSYLWQEIIFDDPIRNVKIRGTDKDWDGLPSNKSLFCQPPGQGIVIGNLSSQLISNIYLDQLDRYMRFELGYKHYGRYVDDFYYIVRKEDLPKALEDVLRIKDFLINIKLTLHPKKQYIQNVQRGVPFLGCIVYPNAIHPGKRMKGHFYDAMMRYAMGDNELESITSYLGYLKHVRGKKLAGKIFELAGSEYNY